jgi:hypothetical protein
MTRQEAVRFLIVPGPDPRGPTRGSAIEREMLLAGFASCALSLAEMTPERGEFLEQLRELYRAASRVVDERAPTKP